MESTDLYAILGIARTATADEMRRVYRKLARKYHPDVNPGNKKAEEQFKRISAAYEILSDPDKRKLYDEFGDAALRGGFDPDKAREYQRWRDSREKTGRPFEAESFDFDLSDLFSDLFGSRPSGPGRAAGQDIHATVEIDLAQALRGAEVALRVPVRRACGVCGGSGDEPGSVSRVCPECGGSGRSQAVRGPLRILATCQSCAGQGRIRTACSMCAGTGGVESEEPITVRIPPGADNGTRLRVAGRGAKGTGGGPAGDIIIETRVRPHRFLRREGLDLHLALPITLGEAYHGAPIEVPTPHGRVKLHVPAHAQSGERLRLKGKGVVRGDKRGDLYVELLVKLPDGESAQLGQAVREADSLYTRPVREGLDL